MPSLKDYRIRADLTQDYVASRLNLDQAAVSHWETGKNRPPRKHHAALCQLYGVTPEELHAAIYGEETPVV